MNTIHKNIEEKLQMNFSPVYLEIKNESKLHHRSLMNIESHFNVLIVSKSFNNKNLLTRHREIYGALKKELSNSIHALSLKSYSFEEWIKINVSTDPVKKPGHFCFLSSQVKK
ncbi:BolA family protein [Candidatus Erwinia haradaeae]|uniref:DNA-binding transcriptional regulator BolA n=1 Tax=Candidatus Erwinia haradaeae TaxID=1922217 RepID=A0A451D2F8_9GAMM|nr:BolA/IbaG family iron-sulfur metabolism protein [Candidatus Erwinia haradaeae]VFP79810.1 DNA-binding transcriptional regulator BolA [Candidatus Erwinia haradaeae]